METHSLTLSPHEVRAALDGTLGLVVRPVKPQPTEEWTHGVQRLGISTEAALCQRMCPLGGPGDRVVGKETWAHDAPSLYDCRRDHEYLLGPCHYWGPYYRADPVHENTGLRWRSPATMPRWASRITLGVGDVRCYRLQDLSRKEMRATGIHLPPSPRFCPTGEPNGSELHQEFADAWNRRYGKRYPWGHDPFVWAVKVKRVEG